MNVVVTGGGTAGHVFPALATATALRDEHGASIVFVGASDGQEARLVPDAGFRFVPVRVTAAQARVSFATMRGWPTRSAGRDPSDGWCVAPTWW